MNRHAATVAADPNRHAAMTAVDPRNLFDVDITSTPAPQESLRWHESNDPDSGDDGTLAAALEERLGQTLNYYATPAPSLTRPRSRFHPIS
jgi:hypothetical protein